MNMLTALLSCMNPNLEKRASSFMAQSFIVDIDVNMCYIHKYLDESIRGMCICVHMCYGCILR